MMIECPKCRHHFIKPLRAGLKPATRVVVNMLRARIPGTLFRAIDVVCPTVSKVDAHASLIYLARQGRIERVKRGLYRRTGETL
jgi:hypothetical protein